MHIELRGVSGVHAGLGGQRAAEWLIGVSSVPFLVAGSALDDASSGHGNTQKRGSLWKVGEEMHETVEWVEVVLDPGLKSMDRAAKKANEK